MKTILCYGDSNTFGWIPVKIDILEDQVVLGNNRFSRDKRWTGILQKELGSDYLIIEEGLCGRTTTHSDPVEGSHKNGKEYLTPCLETHAPIDLVILSLGTNDLKGRFSVSAFDIAWSIAALVGIIQQSASGPDGKAPKVLLLCPTPLGKLTKFAEFFEGGKEKSKELAEYYRKVAKLFGCEFFDIGKIIVPSDIDGVHYDAKEHDKLGRAVAKVTREIFK